MLLELRDVHAGYGDAVVLRDVSLHVGAGELVCLLGANASGKSTTLKTVLGLVRPHSGRVLLDGEDVTERAVRERVARGIAIVPEGRRVFGPLTVAENLSLGAHARGGGAADLERVHALFPVLRERRTQRAGTLSGGEQQMLAMGRALMARPRVLLMDEPSMGLSPALVRQNFEIIRQVHATGVAVLLVEQNARMALSVAERGYVLRDGAVVLTGAADALLADAALRAAYLGPAAS